MAALVLDTAGVTVYSARCPTTQVAGPEQMQGRDNFELCLVRAGCFQYRDSRGRAFVDPATCIFGAPHQVAEITHPDPGGDLDTLIFICPDVLASVGGGSDGVPLSAHVTTAMQVRHRGLLAAARMEQDTMHLEELTLAIVAAALAQGEPARIDAGRPASQRARRQLAEDARTVLTADPTLSSLTELAARLACSPHHLSRVFHQHTGSTLGAYRTALRVNLALEHLSATSPTRSALAEVAVTCGFADHAHLTRTLRRHAGATPAALRAALS